MHWTLAALQNPCVNSYFGIQSALGDLTSTIKAKHYSIR